MKKVVTIVIGLLVWALVSMDAYAEDPDTSQDGIEMIGASSISNGNTDNVDSNYIITNSGKKLLVEELPSFDSKEEAGKYVNEVLKNLNVSKKDYLKKEINSETPAINLLQSSENFRGECTVAKQKVSFGASINLVATYTLTTPNRSGRVKSCDCYTSFTGFTYSFEWNETYKDARIISSGREVAATASGELIFYFLIDGLIEMWREPISLSGTCNPVH